MNANTISRFLLHFQEEAALYHLMFSEDTSPCHPESLAFT